MCRCLPNSLSHVGGSLLLRCGDSLVLMFINFLSHVCGSLLSLACGFLCDFVPIRSIPGISGICNELKATVENIRCPGSNRCIFFYFNSDNLTCLYTCKDKCSRKVVVLNSFKMGLPAQPFSPSVFCGILNE